MSTPEGPGRVDLEAHSWIVEMEAGRLSHQDLRELQAWVEQSLEHREALSRASAFTLLLQEVARRSGRERAPAVSRRRVLRLAVGGLATATIAGVAGIGVEAMWSRDRRTWTQYVMSGDLPLPQGLADRSVIWLNTQSLARVSFGVTRDMQLVQGETLLKVAEEARPFLVHVRNWVLRTLGGVLSVRADAAGIQVAVQQGEVDVLRAGTFLVPLVQIRSLQQAVLFGSSVSAVEGISRDEFNKRLMWAGYVRFVASPLSKAVDRMNRYVTRRIRVVGPTQSLPVSGMWPAADTDGFISYLQTQFHLHARPVGNEVLLEPGR
jgi:transmembrane sensor